MTRRAALALGGMAAALLVLVAGEWLAGQARLARIETPTPLLRQAQRSAPEAGDTGATPEAIDGWVRTALARPLMSSSRRPAPSTEGTGVSLSNGLPRLAGTLFRTDGRIAIFARDDNGHPVIVHEGATLGPYRVTRIVPNSVTLDGPGGTQTLHPRFGEARSGGGPDLGNLPGPLNMPGVMRGLPGLVQPPLLNQDSQQDSQDSQQDSQ